MEKLTRTETKEVVYGYKANDGTFFYKEEECKKYEESAKGVLSKFFRDHVVREIPAYDFGICVGYDEEYLQLVNIPDLDTALKIQQYLELANSDNKANNVVTAADAGKKVWLMHYSDNYYSNFGTTEQLLNTMRKELERKPE